VGNPASYFSPNMGEDVPLWGERWWCQLVRVYRALDMCNYFAAVFEFHFVTTSKPSWRKAKSATAVRLWRPLTKKSEFIDATNQHSTADNTSYWWLIVTVAVLLTFARYLISRTGWKSPLSPENVDPLRRNAKQYQRNLYIAEKNIYWATMSLTILTYPCSFSCF